MTIEGKGKAAPPLKVGLRAEHSGVEPMPALFQGFGNSLLVSSPMKMLFISIFLRSSCVDPKTFHPQINPLSALAGDDTIQLLGVLYSSYLTSSWGGEEEKQAQRTGNCDKTL